MGKTLILTDVDYSTNAIPKSVIIPPVSYTNAELKAMVTTSTSGKYVNNRGVVSSNSSLSYIVLDIRGYDEVVISGYSGTTTGAFLSSDTPSSSSFVSAVTRQSAGNWANERITIPEGATHFAFNFWNSYNNYAFTKDVE